MNRENSDVVRALKIGQHAHQFAVPQFVAYVPQRSQRDPAPGNRQFAHDFAGVGADMALSIVDDAAVRPVKLPGQLGRGGEDAMLPEVWQGGGRAELGKVRGCGTQHAMARAEALADKAAFIGSAGDQVDEVVAAVNELVSAYPDAAKYTPGAIL